MLNEYPSIALVIQFPRKSRLYLDLYLISFTPHLFNYPLLTHFTMNDYAFNSMQTNQIMYAGILSNKQLQLMKVIESKWHTKLFTEALEDNILVLPNLSKLRRVKHVGGWFEALTFCHICSLLYPTLF